MTSSPDIRFEAGVWRAALLAGLVREDDVIAWADALLVGESDAVTLLADVAMAPPKLSPVREALRPLAEPSDVEAVGNALLSLLAVDPSARVMPLPGRVGALAQMRREGLLPSSLHVELKALEDRWMLMSAGVVADPTLAADLSDWLVAVRRPSFYCFASRDAEERAALLGALSRKVVRDRRVRTPGEDGSRAWVVGTHQSHAAVLMVNEPLWQIALTEFSPVPPGSRIPYADVPARAVLVLDEETAEPMGVREATGRLASV